MSIKTVSLGFEKDIWSIAGIEEERDVYLAENIFYVPEESRWD